MLVKYPIIIVINKLMKKHQNIALFVALQIATLTTTYSQCPVIFPGVSGNGAKICLEGTPTNTNDICLENSNGNLKFLMNSNTSNSDLFRFSKNGSLEIGNESSSDAHSITIKGPNQPLGIGSIRSINFDFKDAGKAMMGVYRGGSKGTYFQFYTNDEGSVDNLLPRMQINSDGKVIIGADTRTGITSPGNYRLYVADGILSEKFKAAIKTTGQWSDYVFEDTYKLKPLEEVETFIKVNKHLPDIPSAEQLVKEGGIEVGEMMAKQMAKIEELTLYLIEMKKEIELLKKENNMLKQSR